MCFDAGGQKHPNTSCVEQSKPRSNWASSVQVLCAVKFCQTQTSVILHFLVLLFCSKSFYHRAAESYINWHKSHNWVASKGQAYTLTKILGVNICQRRMNCWMNCAWSAGQGSRHGQWCGLENCFCWTAKGIFSTRSKVDRLGEIAGKARTDRTALLKKSITTQTHENKTNQSCVFLCLYCLSLDVCYLATNISTWNVLYSVAFITSHSAYKDWPRASCLCRLVAQGTDLHSLASSFVNQKFSLWHKTVCMDQQTQIFWFENENEFFHQSVGQISDTSEKH